MGVGDRRDEDSSESRESDSGDSDSGSSDEEYDVLTLIAENEYGQYDPLALSFYNLNSMLMEVQPHAAMYLPGVFVSYFLSCWNVSDETVVTIPNPALHCTLQPGETTEAQA